MYDRFVYGPFKPPPYVVKFVEDFNKFTDTKEFYLKIDSPLRLVRVKDSEGKSVMSYTYEAINDLPTSELLNMFEDYKDNFYDKSRRKGDKYVP